MKQFKDYLAESERVYNYRIKIVGDVSIEFVSQLKQKLDQFDPVKIGSQKSTPVQMSPADFPKFNNDSVTSFDVEFRYPAIEPQIKQLAQILGLDPNRIIMQTSAFDDSIDKERKDVEDENKNLLSDTDFPAPDKEQKALSKDYSAPYNQHAVLKNAYRSDFTVAGGKTPPAQTSNDLPMGKLSPMSTVKRPAKPATGANPRG